MAQKLVNRVSVPIQSEEPGQRCTVAQAVLLQ